MKNKSMRNKVFITVMVCALILVGILGSYAFFISQVGQNKNQEISVQAGTMALTFSDGNNGFNKELNFGESAEKTFTIENTGTKDGVVSVSWMNLLNTYLEGSMTYSFLEADTEDGVYTEIISNKNVPKTKVAEDRVLASGITIPAGTKKYYKLVIQLNYTDFDQTADLQAKMETQFKITEGIIDERTDSEKTLTKLGKTVKEGNPNFAVPATTDETADGLYALEDDYGTSYYYRGATEDNYVKFAGFYWRIIRINGDGSLRIIYDGTSTHINGDDSLDRVALQNIKWSTDFNDTKYVGYMYGGENGVASTSKEEAQTNATNSDIKTVIENWYKTNIADKGYDSYVNDNIFCNDRTVPGKEITEWARDTGLGFGNKITGYGSLSRFLTGNNDSKLVARDDIIPQFTCLQKNDAFTKDDIEKGNGKLEQKVGLIAADEIIAAGSGKQGTNNNSYYLYKGNWYWSLSPSYFYSGYSAVFYENGYLSYSSVNGLGSVAPVISLTSEYVKTLVGDGSMSNPFREVEN